MTQYICLASGGGCECREVVKYNAGVWQVDSNAIISNISMPKLENITGDLWVRTTLASVTFVLRRVTQGVPT